MSDKRKSAKTENGAGKVQAHRRLQASGHLIDSGLMSKYLSGVVEKGGTYVAVGERGPPESQRRHDGEPKAPFQVFVRILSWKLYLLPQASDAVAVEPSAPGRNGRPRHRVRREPAHAGFQGSDICRPRFRSTAA